MWPNKPKLEDTARYAGLLLAPAEGFGRGFFLPFGQKKIFLCCFCPFFGDFWCPVVAMESFSSNLRNFERNKKKNTKKKSKNKNQKFF